MQSGKELPSILITGMKHSGKSCHGEALARHLTFPFTDLDRLVMERYWAQGGKESSVRQLYRNEGKQRFMALEAEAAKALKQDERAMVVSTGGGIADNDGVLAGFHDEGGRSFLIIHLRLPEGLLFARIVAGGLPPFLEGEGGIEGARERFHHLCLRREKVYRRYADLVFDLEDRSRKENSQIIIRGVDTFLSGKKE
jgi:shikimate kinase